MRRRLAVEIEHHSVDDPEPGLCRQQGMERTLRSNQTHTQGQKSARKEYFHTGEIAKPSQFLTQFQEKF